MANMDPMSAKTFKDAREGWLRAYFSALYDVTGGNVSEMSRRAGIGRSHVRGYLKRLGIRSATSAAA